MKNIIITSLLTITCVCLYNVLHSQSTLDKYIEKGIESSVVLQQKNVELEAALFALEASKRKRYLSIDFIPTYTLAQGGRSIAFPAGDLLNPVYSTLNQLTQSSQFPQIDNVDEQLNPNNFYDLKIRTSYPLWNPNIKVNERIHTLQKDLKHTDIEIYTRELAKDISLAYYDYLKTTKAISIYEEAKMLVAEVLRVNKELYKNGKVNRTTIAQNESDLFTLETELMNAQLIRQNAGAYLNFLINEPLDTEIIIDDINRLPPDAIIITATHEHRKELSQLKTKEEIDTQLVSLSKNKGKPQINAFVDIGVQDFDFNIDGNSPYVIGGISMSLNIFSAGKNKLKIQQAESILSASRKNTESLENQLELSVFTAKNALLESINTYKSLREETRVDRLFFDDLLTLYKNGKSNYVSLSDARNEWTNSKLKSDIALYESWKKYEILLRTSGL